MATKKTTKTIKSVATAEAIAAKKDAAKLKRATKKAAKKTAAQDDVFLDLSAGKVVDAKGAEIPPTAKELKAAANAAPLPYSVIDGNDAVRGEFETIDEAIGAMSYDKVKVYTVYGEGGVIVHDTRHDARNYAPAPVAPAVEPTPEPVKAAKPAPAPKVAKPSYRGLKAIGSDGQKVAVDIYIDWKMVNAIVNLAANSANGVSIDGAIRAVVTGPAEK